MKLLYSESVKEGLAQGKPLVAIESSLLSHGMPYPKSFDFVLKVEEVIREKGAIPATVGIMHGEPVIGMGPEQMEELAKDEDRVKVGIAEFGTAIAKKLSGGTTAAATVHLANLAGIKVVVVGGLGGVHRDVLETMDISTDLVAVASNPVVVACGGVKNFLDVPKSLEMLETLGVPVLAYGQDTFPGYMTQSSGCPAKRVECAKEAAEIALAQWKLGLATGVVLGIAVPEEWAFEREHIEEVIQKALCQHQAASGVFVTPALLKAIREATAGRSGDANIALVVKVAAVAAETASALCECQGN